MDANVLLLSLHHPDTFLTHRPHDSEYVHVVGDGDLLQDSIQRNKRTRATHTGTTVHHDGLLVRADSIPERPHESGKRLRWIWHTKVGPRRKVEVSNASLYFALK